MMLLVLNGESLSGRHQELGWTGGLSQGWVQELEGYVTVRSKGAVDTIHRILKLPRQWMVLSEYMVDGVAGFRWLV